LLGPDRLLRLAIGGVAVHRAAMKIVEKARKIAAHELEVAEEDLDYDAGSFTVKGAPDKAKTIPELAFSAWTAHNLPDGMEPDFSETAVYDPQNFVFPYGAHICVVEVDTETGKVDVVKYVAVDDVGTVVNPQIVDGQVMGGVIQGIAEAIFEEAVYDEEGTLQTATLMDYLVPSAAELPSFETDTTVTPSPSNPMGVKGIGEAGTIGAAPAVINAVVDALAPYGIHDMEMPASPQRVWAAIKEAQS